MKLQNVTDVLAVSEGSNEVGVVYATDAASVTDKVDIIAEAPTDNQQDAGSYPVKTSRTRKHRKTIPRQQRLFLDYVEP